MAGVENAGSLSKTSGTPTIALRLRVVVQPYALTAKPFALIVTGVKEQKMSEPLRKWQKQAIEVATNLLNSNATDMSVAAGVGSGKTYFGCRVSETAIALGRAEQIIVVTINRRCQKQWAKKMKQLGMPLKILSGNGSLKNGLPADVCGYITTYASMGMFPDLHAAFCGSKKTIVIFDEVHHINEDEKTLWGKQAKIAFDSAEFRLCLSGTFFSSNGALIPFARMKPRDGANNIFEYDPHVTYSYGESVADGICRRITFKPFDGPPGIEYKRSDETDFKTSNFADNIDPKDIGLRLWAACRPTSDKDGSPIVMLEKMLFSANQRLMDLRASGHDRAGGLIVCSEKSQARDIRALMQKISGHKVVLVLDDEPGANDAIDSFAHGFMPWMVAINMVTEGVDIPRLRIGVYLSNKTKKLTFVQFLGRMVRHFKGEGLLKPDPAGEGYVFYPGDQRLKEIAAAVEMEVQEAIDLREKSGGDEGGGGGGGTGNYQVGSADGEERDNIIAGEMFSAEEIAIAEKLRMQWPNLADEQILSMVRFVRASKPQPTSPPQSPFDPDDGEDHDSLRIDCQKLAQRLAKMRDLEFNDAHSTANKVVGILNIDTATIAQLKAKKAWLREQVEARTDA